jgi:hypothetical protein
MIKRFTLKQGTQIKIGGVPLKLDEDVVVQATPENIRLIRADYPGLCIEEASQYKDVPL